MYDLLELSLELTNSCPLSCRHCSSGSSMPKLPDELSFKTHKRLLEEARGLGATVLSLSGGTPLNYRPYDYDSPQALVDLVNRAIKIEYENILIYVTGHSLYGPTIDRYPKIAHLLGLPNVTWIFSMHSHVNSVNDYIMNKDGALQEILYSIGWLRNLNECVEIHMVPMKPNYHDIPAVRALCARLGVSKISCLRFVPQTRGKANVDSLGMTVKDFAEMQFILSREVDKNGEHPVEVRLGCPIDFRHAVGLLPEKAKPCHAGDDLILVRPQGDVHPCAAWKSLPSDSNVNRMSLDDIWYHSKVFNAIRSFKAGDWLDDMASYAPGYKVIGGPCATCNMLDSCMSGCPAQRLHAYGDNLNGLYVPFSDPLCPRGNKS